MTWLEEKKLIINACKVAGINKEFIEHLILFEKNLNTCKGLIRRGTNWNTMCNSVQYIDALNSLSKMKKDSNMPLYCKIFDKDINMTVDKILKDEKIVNKRLKLI